MIADFVTHWSGPTCQFVLWLQFFSLCIYLTGLGHDRGEEQREIKGSVSLHKVTGRWRKEEEDTLTEISMEVQPGQLAAIIGPVGSGKSSVLQVEDDK